MREIKFRGKRKDAPHEWLFGDLSHAANGRVYIFPILQDCDDDLPYNSPDWYEVIPETVGQYISLKDKDGKEIWEGDIVVYDKDNYEHIALVGFGLLHDACCKHWGFGLHTLNRDFERKMAISNPHYIRIIGWTGIQVIGNIHDNHELLIP